MDEYLVFLLLITILFSIICHGHSEKIFRASFLSLFLAGLTMGILTGDQCNECAFLGFLSIWSAGFPIYFALSFFIGFLYLPLRSRLVALDGLIQKKGEKVTTEAQAVPNRLGTVFWKICFWLIFCGQAFAYTTAFRAGEIDGVLGVSNLFITILAVIGFFCYVYRKKVGFSIFWRTFALLFIGWDIWMLLLIGGYQESDWIGFLLLSPMYLALILYGFLYSKNDLSKMEQSPA